jgi:hypothetical protein
MGEKISKVQRATIEQARTDSVLDPNVPLGYLPAARPELQPSVVAYYKRKHSDPNFQRGRFFGLHRTSIGAR